VTLEPCAHEGRQPPCTRALIEARVARVVIASDDPSERASGRGPGVLRDEGIAVEVADGAEAAAARRLNQAFRKHARTDRPLVVLKSAISLDGRTATATGDSQWISGPESRGLVHRWRAEADAVAVGIGTVLADDPLLTARPEDPSPDAAARQPLRIVFDSTARLPLDSQLARSAADSPVLVLAGAEAPRDRLTALRDAGIEVLPCPGEAAAHVEAALDELGRREITSLMLEGGARLVGSFLDAAEVDELRLFVAPILLGGSGARPLAGGRGAADVSNAVRALAVDWERTGEDLMVRATIREW
jgi:diaminohydroxyphosphoribosylaminopyrimidine deaminase/5-amino-6-(5-phosphoribosylamino)uracil reductase